MHVQTYRASAIAGGLGWVGASRGQRAANKRLALWGRERAPPVLKTRLRAACRVLGHRGGFLALLGGYDLFFGCYLITGGPFIAATLLPEHAWGYTWLAVGALLIYGGTRQRDQWFYTLAAFTKCAWAAEFFRLDLLGVPGQWLRGCYYLAFAAIVVLIASWPET